MHSVAGIIYSFNKHFHFGSRWKDYLESFGNEEQLGWLNTVLVWDREFIGFTNAQNNALNLGGQTAKRKNHWVPRSLRSISLSRSQVKI